MKMEVMPGTSIYIAVQQAIQLGQENCCNIEFKFNDIRLDVSPYSLEDDILRIYDLKCKIVRLKQS